MQTTDTAAATDSPEWVMLRAHASGLRSDGWRAKAVISDNVRACMVCREEDGVTALVEPCRLCGYIVTTYSGIWCTDEAQFSDWAIARTAAEVAGILSAAADRLDHREWDDDL